MGGSTDDGLAACRGVLAGDTEEKRMDRNGAKFLKCLDK